MAFPAILLAIGIAAALGPRMSSVIIALTVAYMPRTARIVRASALVGARNGLRAGRAASPAPATCGSMLRPHPAELHGPAAGAV